MTKKQPAIITDGDKLNAHIIGVSKAASALADSIQMGLASATYQAMFGRNTNHLNALLIAAGRGVRKTAMAQWILAHAPVVLEVDKDKMKEQPFKFSPDKVESLLQSMEGWAQPASYKAVPEEMALLYAQTVHALHWTDHKEPPLVPETWSFTDALKKVLAQATAYEGKGTKVTGGDLRSKMAELLASAQPEADPIAGV